MFTEAAFSKRFHAAPDKRTLKMFERSADQAHSSGSEYIGPKHLLLGYLTDEDYAIPLSSLVWIWLGLEVEF